MKSFSDNEIREKFNNLPLPLKEAIYSADIAEVIVAISAKYGVTGKNVTNVSGEIGFIILGLTRPEEFAPRLAERLGIKPDDAKKLALDAYQAVLKPLAGELKRVHGFDLNESAFDAKSPPVAQQAEPQKPPALVIPPRPVVQQTEPSSRPSQPAPRSVPPPPLRPVPPHRRKSSGCRGTSRGADSTLSTRSSRFPSTVCRNSGIAPLYRTCSRHDRSRVSSTICHLLSVPIHILDRRCAFAPPPQIQRT